MTVKKLTQAQKEAVVTIYTSKIKPRTVTEIAGFLGVSTRTIGRVLDEHAVAGPKAQESIETKKIMALLYKHKIDYTELQSLLENIPQDTLVLLTQTKRSKKSPTGHNGKQTLLPLNLPSLELNSVAFKKNATYEFKENLV